MRTRAALASTFAGLLTLTQASSKMNDCHGAQCNPLSEYCSQISEACRPCDEICDPSTHNYSAKDCERLCGAYNRFTAVQTELHTLKDQQSITFILLIGLIVLLVVRYLVGAFFWLRSERKFKRFINKIGYKTGDAKKVSDGNDADRTLTTLDVTTLQNVVVSNSTEPQRCVDFSPASINRVPTESPVARPALSFGYDNKALAMTPVDQPSSSNSPFYGSKNLA